MTIGIIEDDRLLSRSLKVVLEKEGYRTLQVYTKKDAGQILQGTEELLLVDIGLRKWYGTVSHPDEKMEQKDSRNFSDGKG